MENVSRAATKLHVSEAALSRQIRDLEDETGFQLFERTAKSVSLTNAGRGFLNDARALVKQADAAVRKAHSVAHPGEIEIHVGSALCCSFARSSVMLKRALPIVLAALVIAPTMAQSQRTQPGTSMIPPTYPQRGDHRAGARLLPRALRLAAQEAGRRRDEHRRARTRPCSSRSRTTRPARTTWRCS